MKNALLITYYWPPAGGPGVHRWLRFSKFFSQYGWNLTVYCPENAEWPVIDNDLNHQVDINLNIIRKPIWEPHKYLGKKNNPNKGGAFTNASKPNLKSRIIMWIRGNLFIPDARKYWIKPSVAFLTNYLREHPEISVVISTGPPHSLHLIAKQLKENTNVKWVADFRDPWTGIDFYEELMLSAKADARHKQLELECLSRADEVVTVSKHCAEGLAAIAGRKVRVITNGFQFEQFNSRSVPLDSVFRLSHFGSMPFSRNPDVIWKALSRLLNDMPELSAHLCIQLIGPVDVQVIQSIQDHGLKPFLDLVPQVSHAQSIKMQKESATLLLVANNTGNSKGTLTGKFFEYLGAQRPILAVGPSSGDLEEAMLLTQSGAFFDYQNVEYAYTVLKNYYLSWKNNDLYISPQGRDVFDSSVLAGEFCKLLDKISLND